MNKKRIWSIGVLALAVVLIASIGVTAVLAQDDTTGTTETTDVTSQPHRGHGRHGMPHLSDDALAAAAEVLNMTTDELTSELQAGKSIANLAEEAGVEEQDVWDAINAVRVVEIRADIAQAVEDGTMTQEKADWLLEGLDKGFLTDSNGLVHLGHFGLKTPPSTDE
jgi:uncharacterized membrane protein